MTETEGCNFTRTSSLSRPAPKKFRSASATPRPRSLSTPRDELGVKTPQEADKIKKRIRKAVHR
ncbi:hypothetical protein T11_5129, partial [Trichinella zimbabwensis]